MKRDYFYIGAILLLIGAGLFGSIHSNRKYKQGIKALEKENHRKQLSIDSLKASVTQRDIQDSIFKAQVNQLDITTTNANHRTIINMPVDSFMLLFSAYIDSAGKAVN